MLLLLAQFLLQAADYETAAVILRAKCMACHSAKSPAAGLSLESREQIFRGGKSGPAVVAGKPVDSLLLTMISTGKMPVNGARLTPAEIETIRKWIESETGKPPVGERDVQAILSAKCWVCHGRREQRGGLDLRTQASMLKGGKSGPAVIAGDADSSLLVKRIAAQQMPPPKLQEQYSVRGLRDDELAKVKQWIGEGAKAGDERAVEVSAASDPAIKKEDREFWSFRTPRRPPVPKTANPIDAFLPAKLPAAAPLALLRRAFFDLTGLPPTPEQIAQYDGNYAALLDRLLESPRYGERWARHWLDAMGYADSEGGNNSDQTRKNAWRYRDYVIRAFQANKPYDRFLTEQIAGDELFDYRTVKPLTSEHIDLMAATGFWRMAPDGTNSTEQNFIPERMDVIAGQIEILGSAVMGVSIGCARCHDHKYDPLPTRDYYRLVSILTPAFDPYAWLPGEFPCGGVGAKCDENNTRYYIAKATPEYEAAVAHNAPIEARIEELEKKARALKETDPEYKKEKAALDEQIRKERGKRKEPPLIRALFDLGPQPPPTRILMRGDVASPGALVAPGPPSIMSAGLPEYRVEPLAHSSGRRLALAKWLTHPNHPLTARVMVNRIWQHHFGTGLVSTPGNFGRMGAAPTNQPLLDWLATEFVRTGWDVKAMHRLIMSSAAYRQQTGEDGFPLRRIDAESIRDTILQLAGRLETRQYGPPDAIKQLPDGEVVTGSLRRSIYVAQKRTQPVSLLETFDQPFMNPNCVKRGQSVVSSQALHLMNSDLVRENARYMAGRIADEVGDNADAQIERAYLLALTRKPSAGERDAARETMERLMPEWRRKLEAEKPAEPIAGRARWLALATICHTLMNSAEFLYVD
ncbi:MAG: PSD1 and planctomycete cytochrome C domain-containing protein [Bryobacteraceae bacterium]|nr:PSD1 and planctomycete cytochrome C domain-containing protein [Bryobacteraceae bacterium]